MQKQEIIKAIKETMARVAPNAKVILFGSQARGDAKTDSDWDLLILIDKDKITQEDFNMIFSPLYDLTLKFETLISPIFYTVKDWTRRSFTLFYKNVMKEGIEL